MEEEFGALEALDWSEILKQIEHPTVEAHDSFLDSLDDILQAPEPIDHQYHQHDPSTSTMRPPPPQVTINSQRIDLFYLASSNTPYGVTIHRDRGLIKFHKLDTRAIRMLLELLQTYNPKANDSHEIHEVVVDTQPNDQNRGIKNITTCNATGLISLQDLEQHYGKTREEAAESFQVSVSTFKRICRNNGIKRWPSTKRKRNNCFLSAGECNASVQPVAGGEHALTSSPNALVSISSSSGLINESHQALSLSPHKHYDYSPSLNCQNTPGKSQTTNGSNMHQGRDLELDVLYKSIYKPRYDSSSTENPMPNALERKSQRPPYSMDEITHFQKQASEISNSAPKRRAVNINDSSSLRTISGTIEGINEGYDPNSNSVTVHDVVDDYIDSNCAGVQPSLDSTQPLNSLFCNESCAQNTKLHFDNLITLPLKDLINPENETYMTKALPILADNLSLFSEEQAEQILELSFEFPVLVHSWREYSRSQMHSQKSFAEMEKIRDLVETSAKDEESLKVKYEELESKEKELMAQFEAVQKEKAGVAEQRNEKFKQTRHLASLAEGQETGRTKEKHLMKMATTKLNNLVDRWASIQSFFT